jgi:hypothetical protein
MQVLTVAGQHANNHTLQDLTSSVDGLACNVKKDIASEHLQCCFLCDFRC